MYICHIPPKMIKMHNNTYVFLIYLINPHTWHMSKSLSGSWFGCLLLPLTIVRYQVSQPSLNTVTEQLAVGAVVVDCDVVPVLVGVHEGLVDLVKTSVADTVRSGADLV